MHVKHVIYVMKFTITTIAKCTISCPMVRLITGDREGPTLAQRGLSLCCLIIIVKLIVRRSVVEPKIVGSYALSLASSVLHVPDKVVRHQKELLSVLSDSTTVWISSRLISPNGLICNGNEDT